MRPAEATSDFGRPIQPRAFELQTDTMRAALILLLRINYSSATGSQSVSGMRSTGCFLALAFFVAMCGQKNERNYTRRSLLPAHNSLKRAAEESCIEFSNWRAMT